VKTRFFGSSFCHGPPGRENILHGWYSFGARICIPESKKDFYEKENIYNRSEAWEAVI
jgi:hypothetical protein